MPTLDLRLWLFCVLLACFWSSNVLAKTCTISGGAVAFGVYDPTSSANLDSIGSVTLECNGRIKATLSVSVGSGVGASYFSGRRMTRIGGSTLKYNLYANASRTKVLGDGTGGSVTLEIEGLKFESQAIWARIPAQQANVLSGSYVDTVLVTISY